MHSTPTRHNANVDDEVTWKRSPEALRFPVWDIEGQDDYSLREVILGRPDAHNKQQALHVVGIRRAGESDVFDLHIVAIDPTCAESIDLKNAESIVLLPESLVVLSFNGLDEKMALLAFSKFIQAMAIGYTAPWSDDVVNVFASLLDHARDFN